MQILSQWMATLQRTWREQRSQKHIRLTRSYQRAVRIWQLKCLRSLQLSTQNGFEDVTSNHKCVRQKHQRGEANHCASVFFSRLPVCHGNVFEHQSLIAAKALCMVTLFWSANKTPLVRSFNYQFFLPLTTVSVIFQSRVPLTPPSPPPLQVCG